MDMVDSKQQQLQPSQILDIAYKNTGAPYSLEQAKKVILAEFQREGSWSVQYGNTIFLVHTVNKPRQGFFRAFNADTAQNYLENSRKFVEAAYATGYDVLVTQFTDSSILGIFKAIAKNPPREDMGYQAKRTTDGGFQVILQLGTPRGEA